MKAARDLGMFSAVDPSPIKSKQDKPAAAASHEQRATNFHFHLVKKSTTTSYSSYHT